MDRLPCRFDGMCRRACPQLNPPDRADGDVDATHRDFPTSRRDGPSTDYNAYRPASDADADTDTGGWGAESHGRQVESATLRNNTFERWQGIPTVAEFVAPDRFRFVTASDDIIVIGQKVFIKQKGVFVESSIPATAIVDFRGLERAGDGIDGIQLIGAESMNGQRIQVYQYAQKVKAGDTEASIKRTVWIDVAAGLLLKMTIDGVSLGLDTKTGKTAHQKSSSIVLFEYDPSIKIELPTK